MSCAIYSAQQTRKQSTPWGLADQVETMSGELFKAPFNLAGESQSNEITSEGQARAKAEAEAIARKAQLLMAPMSVIETALAIHKRQNELEAKL